jgi:hypothetical protein
MNSRRDFLKVVTGQHPNREIKIALNRLHELPDTIIEQIEPVLFPDEDWELVENVIYLRNQTEEIERTSYKLDIIDIEIFNDFRKNIKLKNTAETISTRYNIPYSDSWLKVTSLFFKLANLRICHPKEVYQIDKIINKR